MDRRRWGAVRVCSDLSQTAKESRATTRSTEADLMALNLGMLISE